MSRVLISENLTRPRGVAVDYEAGHLYWTDEVTVLVLGGVNHYFWLDYHKNIFKKFLKAFFDTLSEH